MADEIVRLAVDNSRINSDLSVLAIALRQAGNESFLNDTIEQLARLAGVTAEQYEIIYPPQRDPLPEKPRYSKKTGKQLKPRTRKRYKRTGVLGGRLTSTARQEANNVWLAVVGTKIEYAPYVVGMPTDDPGQAWFHQNYWDPLETQLILHLPDIIQVVQDRLTFIVRNIVKFK